MKALFAWPMRRGVPAYSTGENGLPVATSARPALHSIACSGVHSAIDVGLDRMNTTGLEVFSLTASITSRLNSPG